MAAISDSSPLIVFARAGRFDLLRAVFDEIIVPPAVWSEVVDSGHGRPGVAEMLTASWIVINELATVDIANQLHRRLGPGESEAIALALQSPHMPILLDDGDGRRVASELGLQVVGSAGVLLRAKEYGFISEVRPALSQLREAGLRLGPSAIVRILQLAQEARDE